MHRNHCTLKDNMLIAVLLCLADSRLASSVCTHAETSQGERIQLCKTPSPAFSKEQDLGFVNSEFEHAQD